PWIPDVADQLLLLGVHADDRESRLTELLPLRRDVAELLIPPRGVRAQAPPLPDISPQGESHSLEQCPYGIPAHGEPPGLELFGQIRDAAPHPSLCALGAPCDLIAQQVLQRRRDRRMLLLRSRPPGALLMG